MALTRDRAALRPIDRPPAGSRNRKTEAFLIRLSPYDLKILEGAAASSGLAQ